MKEKVMSFLRLMILAGVFLFFAGERAVAFYANERQGCSRNWHCVLMPSSCGGHFVAANRNHAAKEMNRRARHSGRASCDAVANAPPSPERYFAYCSNARCRVGYRY